MASNTTLRFLSLRWNQIGDQGDRALARRCYRVPYHTLTGLITYEPEMALLQDAGVENWEERRDELAKIFIRTRPWLAEDHIRYFRLGDPVGATIVEVLFYLGELREGALSRLPYEVLFMIFDWLFK